MTDLDLDGDLDLELDEAPWTAAEWRSATVAEVSTSRREISVVAVPYDEDADIWEHARHYVESFARTAFAGVQRRLGGRRKVTVNREHDAARTIGKVLTLEPNHADGLHATMRLTKGTALADETLALAADDVLGASISFSPMVDGEEWSDDGQRRRITRAYLHHIALVPEPAYEGAGVLAVRHLGSPPPAPSPAVVVGSSTPWLDKILAQRAASRYGLHLTP